MENSIAEAVAGAGRPDAANLCWHLITSEYPPQRGGVGDYTRLLAAGLAHLGDQVHVWCPAFAGPVPVTSGVTVHREFGTFSRKDLRRVGEKLQSFPGQRRIVVQWVPHGYGYKAMNIGFCWWLWRRAKRHGDRIELMVHEPYLPFRPGAARQNTAAVVHRAMTMIMLRAASRVWMSIPGWEPRLRPFTLGRRLDFQWLPIFSNIPVADQPGRVFEIRRQYAGEGAGPVIGHFGTFAAPITDLLEPILLELAAGNGQELLLVGDQSKQYLERLTARHPSFAGRIHATGKLSAEEVSCHLAACDLLIQPFPDGVSSRRTSFMAGLAHGKPIVTTTGELTEPLWSEVDGVYLAAPGDTAGFVERVRTLAHRPDEWLRAGSAARRLYHERFDSRHIIGRLRGAVTGDFTCAY